MKKQILNLGKALNKTEQKQINGGLGGSLGCNHMAPCEDEVDCGDIFCQLLCYSSHSSNPKRCIAL